MKHPDTMHGLPEVLRAMRRRGYAVFENPIGCDLNIVGVRSAERVPLHFDDELHVFWREGEGWQHLVCPVTTDPGIPYLEDPMNPAGTAIVVPGQYRGVWTLGLHKGQYPALVQRAPISVYRDGDRDGELDTEGVRTETGMFGINLHRARLGGRSILVDRWSAGCQVVAEDRHLDLILDKCREQALKLRSNRFTYTLLTHRQVVDHGALREAA